MGNQHAGFRAGFGRIAVFWKNGLTEAAAGGFVRQTVPVGGGLIVGRRTGSVDVSGGDILLLRYAC